MCPVGKKAKPQSTDSIDDLNFVDPLYEPAVVRKPQFPFFCATHRTQAGRVTLGKSERVSYQVALRDKFQASLDGEDLAKGASEIPMSRERKARETLQQGFWKAQQIARRGHYLTHGRTKDRVDFGRGPVSEDSLAEFEAAFGMGEEWESQQDAQVPQKGAAGPDPKARSCLFPGCTNALDAPVPVRLDRGQGIDDLYPLYLDLLETFEMRRLSRIQMTGFLALKFPSSTHTRLAHAVGTWTAGLWALENIHVDGDPLIDYLVKFDIHREFMAALLIHDIGHGPFSHVLEMNPELNYDHERIAVDLIAGGPAHFSLARALSNNDLELGCLFEGNGAFYSGLADRAERARQKLSLVRDVCVAYGLDTDLITDLFSGKPTWKRDHAVEALRPLVTGIVDIDRVDHVYRDLHNNSFRTMGLPLLSFLRGIHISTKGTKDGRARVELRREALPVAEVLICAREQSHKAIFDEPVNRFFTATINRAILDAVRLIPFLKLYIPFLTDEGLLHLLMSRELFGNLSPASYALQALGGESLSDYIEARFQIRVAPTEEEQGAADFDELDFPPPRGKGAGTAQDYRGLINRVLARLSDEHGWLFSSYLKDVRGSYRHTRGEGSVSAVYTYVDSPPGWQNIEDTLGKLIDGVTYDGNINRSYSFSIFVRNDSWHSGRDKDVARELQAALREEQKTADIDYGDSWLCVWFRGSSRMPVR